MSILETLSRLDLIAFALFVVGWGSYELYGAKAKRDGIGLPHHMHIWRQRWMMAALERDNRILDVQIIRSVTGNSAFLASTAILVIGGLAALMGAAGDIVIVLNGYDFFAETSQNRFGLKLAVLIVIFVHAFFRLAWSMRLNANASITLGAIRQPEVNADLGEARARADTTADLLTLGAKHYNSGMHSYYFGLAAGTWFIHPAALIVATVWVLITLYRREYRSRALASLVAPGGEG